MRASFLSILVLLAWCCVAQCGVRQKRHGFGLPASGHPLPNEDLINSIFQIPIGVLQNVGNVLKTAIGIVSGSNDSGSDDSDDDSGASRTEKPARLVS